MASGPEALFVFKSDNCFATPLMVIDRQSMAGYLIRRAVGEKVVKVKFDERQGLRQFQQYTEHYGSHGYIFKNLGLQFPLVLTDCANYSHGKTY